MKMDEMRNESVNRKKKRVMLPFHVVFCYLLVVTLIFTGIGLAKYSHTVTGNTEARVAAFIVDTSYTATPADGFTIDFSTGTETEKDVNTLNFTVSNSKDGKTAEVAIKYKLVVTLPQALPDGLTMKMSTGGTEGITGTASADGKVYTFSDAGWTFSAGTGQTRSHTLRFIGNRSTLLGATTETEITLTNVSVSVLAEQIQ